MAEEGTRGKLGSGLRERILAAAAQLLETGGRSAVSTRAVSAAAGVQAPTIYRLFGDKQGLLHALAADGFDRYLAGRAARAPSQDPLEDVRAGWDAHVELDIGNPALYLLLFDEPSAGSPATGAATDMLAALIHRLAQDGRLHVPEQRAVQLLDAAARGTTLSLIAQPEGARDSELSRTAREAVLSAITSAAEPAGAAPHARAAGRLVRAAVMLQALLPHAHQLTGRSRPCCWSGSAASPTRPADPPARLDRGTPIGVQGLARRAPDGLERRGPPVRVTGARAGAVPVALLRKKRVLRSRDPGVRLHSASTSRQGALPSAAGPFRDSAAAREAELPVDRPGGLLESGLLRAVFTQRGGELVEPVDEVGLLALTEAGGGTDALRDVFDLTAQVTALGREVDQHRPLVLG